MSFDDKFPENVIADAEAVKLTEQLFHGRKRALGVTIDGAVSKDLDDAIYAERLEDGYRVQISIADVTAIIKPGSALYEEALNRVETRYYSTHYVPMLPRTLSEDTLSLLEREPRLTLTFFLELDSNFDIRKASIRETFLVSRRRMTYAQVDQIVDSRPQHPDFELLSSCTEIAYGLLEKRRHRGALAMFDISRSVYTSEEGQINPLIGEIAYKGSLIVQEFMILANQATARFFADQGVPMLFRNHTMKDSTPERDEIVMQFNAVLLNPATLDALTERISLWFDKASYDPVLKGHYGLNEAAYTHVTSPIRRVADLLNHYIVKAFLAGQSGPYSRDELDEISTDINEKLQAFKEELTEVKTKAANKTPQQLAYEGNSLVKLSPGEFRQVVKQASRNPVISHTLEQAIMSRFEMNAIDVSNLYTILFESLSGAESWIRIRETALDFAMRTLGFSNQLLNLHSQKGNIENFEIESEHSVDGFLARVVATVDGQPVSSPYYALGENKKEAHHLASYDFLEAYLQHKMVHPEQTQQADNRPSQTEITINRMQSQGGNYVGQLNELCAGKMGWGTPRYQFQQSGPSHSPIMVCDCTLLTPAGTIQSAGKGTNKKVAKQVAAKSMMQLIEDKDLQEAAKNAPKKPAAHQEENFVGRLNETCQKNNWPMPEYAFQRTGPDHSPHFMCTVSVQTLDGVREVSGNGASKKVAKRSSARNCLELLRRDRERREAEGEVFEDEDAITAPAEEVTPDVVETVGEVEDDTV